MRHTLTFLDYTLEEFLDRTRDDRYPDAQDSILATCITYLSFRDARSGPCKDRKELESRLSRNAFLWYVARYWGYYALGSRDPGIQDTVLAFLMDRPAVSSCSQLAFLEYDTYELFTQERPEQITAMHLAAHFGLTHWIKILLENGMAADPSTRLGRTPLSLAAQQGFAATVRLFSKRRGQDVNIDSMDSSGRTPLHYAASEGHARASELLIENGATVDMPNKRGLTPLHLAAENGYESTVQVLIDAGSDVNARSDTKTTPLYRAARRGHVPVIRRLLAAKADPDLLTWDGYSPLRTAVGYNQTGAVGAILTAKLNLNFVGVDGRTSLEVAKTFQNKEVIRMLENAALERSDSQLQLIGGTQ